MSADASPLSAVGERVHVRPPRPDDEPAYRAAVTASSDRLSDFAVPDPGNLPAVVASQSDRYRTFMVWARDPGDGHGLVGRVNVANVVAGRFRSATIGYDAYDPYAGTGLFAEGLRLVLDLAFAPAPRGLGLHRVEANVQPTNPRSAGLVRSLGFVHEGYSRDFLWMPGPDGREAWRDHERFTALSSAWPAEPYAVHPPRRVACVVERPDGAGPSVFAARLAAELGVPLLSDAALEGVGVDRAAAAGVLFELLRASAPGGVVECRTPGLDVRERLARSGFDPDRVPVVPAPEVASRREVVRRALAVRAAQA